ncbi:hypothetical protein ACQP0U_17550 [Micromonospora sp. CA-269861]|uniref:hypothetical protein n=1 Tax=Micromonospora sp. CA-269861 TaxID=3239968 RepID=UPI003D908D8B
MIERLIKKERIVEKVVSHDDERPDAGRSGKPTQQRSAAGNNPKRDHGSHH